MFHYAFWAFFLVLGSGTCLGLAPVPTTHMTDGTTVLPPAPTTTTAVPPPAPMTTTAVLPPAPTTTTAVPPPAPTTTTVVPPPAPTTTTVPPPAPTTTTAVPPPAPTTTTVAPSPAPTTTTAAPPPAPTTTTVPPPAPTTEGTNVTTAPPPAPTTEGTNVTTVLPPEPTTEGTNVTTLPPLEPTTEGTNITTLPPPEPTTEGTNVTTLPPPAPTTPTAAPAPTPVPHPAVGSYNVRSDVNSTACLMATMGLQISYKEGTVLKSVNLDPNTTVATGKCGDNESDASLALTFDKSSVTFTFSEEGGKFRLHAVNVTLNPGATGTAFSAANTNLSLWEASVGSSYLCRKDQSYNITDALTLHTLGLQVQPFGVKNSSYATAEECFLDSDLTFLVPIAVGVALAFLIVLVLISYLIGRRKSRTGYQSV